jgi:tRNA A-37 threonylcarbamoyl transferase component Bud32
LVDEEGPPLETVVARRVRDASPRGQDLVARLARAGIESKLFGQPMQQIRVDRYEVLAELGTGGMGVVYRARDPQLDREVAIKLLRPAGTTRHDPETSRARLVREARAMARLSHPNVLTVHEVGTFEDQVFVAMEYVEGRTLSEWLAQAERPWPDVLEAFLAAGRGLAAAHDKGIVHRDFKPENVMVSDDPQGARGVGRVLVLDFGLARSAEAPEVDDDVRTVDAAAFDASLTLTGALVGTPAYMAPELYAGKPADERSDQFAFCVALWEAVYRQRPFAGDTLAALAHAVMEGEIRSPIGVGARPAWLRRVLERGLAVDPLERYESMHALLDAIAFHRRPRWHQRWMPAVIGGGALAVGLLLMATASRLPKTRPPIVTAVPVPSAGSSTAEVKRELLPEPAPADPALVATGGTAAATEASTGGDTGPSLVAELATERPQVRRQRAARRPSYAHAWCYVREDDFARAREPSTRLEKSWRRGDTCWACYEYGDPDGLRKRVNQTDCERYALCHEDTCR